MSTSKNCLLQNFGQENTVTWDSIRNTANNCFPAKPETVVSSNCLKQKLTQNPNANVDENDFWNLAGQCAVPLQMNTVEPFLGINQSNNAVCVDNSTIVWIVVVILVIILLLYLFKRRGAGNSFGF